MLTRAAWYEYPRYDDAERAAQALAEAATTRLSDRPGAATDEIWAEAVRHHNERRLGALVLIVALTNFFNRLNTTGMSGAGAVDVAPQPPGLTRWMSYAALADHLVVPTGENAVLPWTHDRMGQPPARAAAARHSAGLGARLPVRRMRMRAPAFRVRTGIARAAETSR
jgi:hypothetical protein